MNYTHHWVCGICSQAKESVDLPKIQVCEDCIEPIAKKLCRDALGVELNTPGVDRQHWMRMADAIVAPMMRRRRSPRDI